MLAGLRALTHVRVDDRAGLPKGSTSNHFRTRAALLSGVVDWIVQREMREVTAASVAPTTSTELVDAFCGLFEYTTEVNRVLTTARFVLFMEASHNVGLRESVSRGRDAMASAVAPVLAKLGASDPQVAAEAVMACFEGLILHRIARGDVTDPRATFDLIVRAALGDETKSG